jgi:hypothetical protein
MPIDFQPDAIDFQPDEAPAVSADSPLEDRLAAAKKKILAKNPNAFTDTVNNVRTPSTIGGEFKGGLNDFAQGLKTAFVGDKTDPGMSTFERILHGVAAPTGLIRSALSPLSPVNNAAQAAGETASDALDKTKIGHTNLPGTNFNLADVLGALTEAGVGYGAQAGIGKLASVIQPKIVNAFPNLAEKGKAITQEGLDQANAIKSEALRQTRQARRAVDRVAANTDAAVGSEESIGAGARDYARQQAAAAQSAVPTEASFNLPAPTSEQTGSDLAASYKAKKAESTARFDTEYDAVKADAAKVKASTDSYTEAIDKVNGERGVSSVGQTSAEGTATKAQSALDSKLPEKPTVADLITERQRVRRAGNDAYRSGDYNLTRQYQTLEDGLAADINKAPTALVDKLDATDAAYASEHAPFYGARSELRKAFDNGPESVIDALVPKAGDANRVAKLDRLQQFVSDPAQARQVGDAFAKNMVSDATDINGTLQPSKLAGKWAQYADSRTGDKVLKGVLGDRYDGMKQLVQSMQEATPADIQSTLKTTLANIDKNTTARVGAVQKAQLEKMNSLQGMLGEGDKFVEGLVAPGKAGSITLDRQAKMAALDKEIQQKLGALGVKPISDQAGALVGSASMLHGAVGFFMGSAAATAQVVTGGLIFLGAPAVLKLMAKARGLELLNKSMRAAPGTAVAAANARMLQQYLQREQKHGK